MAYIIGLLTPAEERRLELRGWEIEPAPKELVPQEATPGKHLGMVWVDADMLDIMSGPDWEVDTAGPPPRFKSKKKHGRRTFRV